MKKVIIATFAALFMLGASTICQAQKKAKTIEALEIKVSAECEMCKEKLEKAMAYEKGVKDFSVDLEKRILTLKYDASKTNPDKIRQVISKLGYDADEVKADPVAYAKLPACCKSNTGSTKCSHEK